VAGEVGAGTRVAGGRGAHTRPVGPPEEDGVGRAAGVRGADECVGAAAGSEPRHGRRGDAGQVDEVHEHRVRCGFQPFGGREPGAQ
jgi:hypothetical protein